MAHIIEDRVRETTTTTGTGAITLAGAATGFRTFSSVMTSPSDTCYYVIAGGAEWETGIGTYSAANTLTRTTVLRSSNANAAVSFSAGTKDVFMTLLGTSTLIENPDASVTLQSLGTSVPATPASGNVGVFGRSVAGRQMPAFIGPSGLDSVLQPGLMRNKVCWFQPQAGTATLTASNGLVLTATGTATAKSPASTNIHTQTAGVDFLVTTAATTAVAGFRSSVAQFWRGNAAGLGGFTFVCRWAPATGAATTTSRGFVGLANSTSAPTDVEPSSQLNIIGMGYDAADTNLQIMSNDGTSTATKVNLGASFPVPTTDRSKVYELALFAAPNDSTVQYEVTDLGTGAKATGTISTDLPSSTTFLAPRGYCSVGGTSSVIGITLFSLYVETDF